MQYFNPQGHCRNCSAAINQHVIAYSTTTFGHPLCNSCQVDIGNKFNYSSHETINLYFSLRERGVPAELEKFDGYKTIDISIVPARVNIEVDGPQRLSNAELAIADLQRTFLSVKKGFLTLHIPNILVRQNLKQTVDYVTDLLNFRLQTYKSA
jgi:hypothetical protein